MMRAKTGILGNWSKCDFSSTRLPTQHRMYLQRCTHLHSFHSKSLTASWALLFPKLHVTELGDRLISMLFRRRCRWVYCNHLKMNFPTAYHFTLSHRSHKDMITRNAVYKLVFKQFNTTFTGQLIFIINVQHFPIFFNSDFTKMQRNWEGRSYAWLPSCPQQ
jgi:hypothetical protein